MYTMNKQTQNKQTTRQVDKTQNNPASLVGTPPLVFFGLFRSMSAWTASVDSLVSVGTALVFKQHTPCCHSMDMFSFVYSEWHLAEHP